MKRKYIIAVKKLMLWHFSNADIRETLEDISLHFDSAAEDGITESRAAAQYGKASDIVNNLINNNLGSRRINTKSMVITALMAILVVAVLLLPESFPRFLLPVAVAVFIWYTSGSSCLAGIIQHTKKELKNYTVLQAVLFALSAFAQTGALLFVPGYFEDTLDGSFIIGIIYILAFILLVTAIFSLWDMLNGNIYMFFIIVQSVSLLYDLVWYYKFLFNIDTIGNISFIFSSYLVSVPLMAVWWFLCYRRRNNGCTI